MNAVVEWLLVSLMMLLIDIPWLLWTSESTATVVKGVQGSVLKFRPEGALIVYPAMGYLLLRANSMTEAFLIGLAAYLIYDFTNYATLTNYPLWFAVRDSLYGGLLFAVSYYLLKILI
jgi:uncharacterized membrane protein